MNATCRLRDPHRASFSAPASSLLPHPPAPGSPPARPPRTASPSRNGTRWRRPAGSSSRARRCASPPAGRPRRTGRTLSRRSRCCSRAGPGGSRPRAVGDGAGHLEVPASDVRGVHHQEGRAADEPGGGRLAGMPSARSPARPCPDNARNPRRRIRGGHPAGRGPPPAPSRQPAGAGRGRARSLKPRGLGPTRRDAGSVRRARGRPSLPKSASRTCARPSSGRPDPPPASRTESRIRSPSSTSPP